ncbi:MAG: ATP-binding protein, partial [Thermoanaerobaculia bacterium]|nr:ATP-binding protein [Thermoanaerobaculia bacterium]
IRIKTLVSAARSVLNARRHQYEVRDLLRELEQRIQERDEFLAMLGHELRNPLHAITLASAEEGDASDEADGKFEIIRRQSRHLERLVDDLLDISRVTRGKIELQKKRVDFGKLVAQTIEETVPKTETIDRTLQVDLPDEPLFVEVDDVRIHQVLSNLITNALKYTEPGGTIRVRTARRSDRAVLEIEDDGEGIPRDLLPKVFDLFAQGGATNDNHQQGLGIGLTLVERLLDLHGGTITADSDGPGTGTRFTVSLPLCAQESGSAEEGSDTEHDSSGLAEERTVLLIEDNEDIRTLLAARLERLGFTVLQEASGKEGAQRAVEKNPDVVVIDIGLPGIDGHEVARRVRNELGETVRLIAVTGYGQPEDREKALEAGFDTHLAKPVKAEQLKETISSLFRTANSRPA